MSPARRRPAALAAALAAPAAAVALIATATPASAATLSENRAAVLKLVNNARAAAGCGALVTNSKLTTAAQGHANDMSAKGYFNHTSQDGTTWSQRIRNTGYTSPGGENIARGFSTADAVMKAWMNSDSHRKNIVNCKFNAIGIGWASTGNYWVQDFGYV